LKRGNKKEEEEEEEEEGGRRREEEARKRLEQLALEIGATRIGRSRDSRRYLAHSMLKR
jgi:hypothetical protein